MQRRTFIMAGAAGGALLAAAGWWTIARGPLRGASAQTTRRILGAIVPAMLGAALPREPAERATAVDDTIAGVEHAIAGLPPSARGELGQLFALLDIDVARRTLAGVDAAWHEASVADVDAFLSNWQASRWALKRSAYDALHQLIFAAWYGQERAWPAIGYPGPPAVPEAST